MDAEFQAMINDLLSHANILDVVRHYLHEEPVKSGKNYLFTCPFHDDHKPSMSVSVELQIYKCWSCQAGGNAINFIAEIEHIRYMEAARKLAELVGYSNPKLMPRVSFKRIDPEIQKLYDCINDLQSYYRYCLNLEEAKQAREYLQKRCLDLDIQAKYGIGYAPLDGEKTVAFLKAKGHSIKTMEDIGILTGSVEHPRDRFAGRITFALSSPSGQVVGFSARQIIRDENSGKYVNSPECKLFHKSNLLYNFHNAKSAAQKEGKIYVLEGFMDVIALDRAGLPNAVALMGTALTDQHAKLLKSIGGEVRFCLDGDDAGQTGMLRGLKVLTKAGISLQIVDYGGDSRDPDDILQEEGAEALVAKMNHLQDVVDFQLDYYTRVKRAETTEDKHKLIEYFLPTLSSEGDIAREGHIAKLSKSLDYDASAIRMLINRKVASSEESIPSYYYEEETSITPSAPMIARLTKRLAIAEDTILYYLLKDKDAREFVANHGNPIYSSVQRNLAFLILQYANGAETIDLKQLLGYLGQVDETQANSMSSAAIAAASVRNPIPYSEQALLDCQSVIETEKKKNRDDSRVKEAIETGDASLAASALKALAEKKKANWDKKKKS